MGSFELRPEDIDFDDEGRVVLRNEELASHLRARRESERSARANVTIDILCRETNIDCPFDDPPPGNILCGCSVPMGDRRCV